MRGTAWVMVACAVAALALIEPLGASPTPWAKLHRALHLPRLAPGVACPVTRIDRRLDWKHINIFGGSGIGRGPVYPGLGGSGGTAYARADDQYGGPWASGKVFWYVRPSYRGRVLAVIAWTGRSGWGSTVAGCLTANCVSSPGIASRGRGSRPGAAAFLQVSASSCPAATESRSTARPSAESLSSLSRFHSLSGYRSDRTRRTARADWTRRAERSRRSARPPGPVNVTYVISADTALPNAAQQ